LLFAPAVASASGAMWLKTKGFDDGLIGFLKAAEYLFLALDSVLLLGLVLNLFLEGVERF
jgi:hypothetical protein